MNCPTCGAVMRPLLLSWYCPKDCDRRVIVKAPEPALSASVGYDMTSHVWVWNNAPVPIGHWFVIGSGERMFKSSAEALMSQSKFGCYALLLRGIDGRATGWIVPTGVQYTRSYIQGQVVAVVP